MKIGFDNEKYLKLQSEKIKERMQLFDGKLYIEFGGKILDDYHANRVLPGFEANSKTEMLKQLKDDIEVIFCINANDIEKNKIRDDHGITYDVELIRLISGLRELGICAYSVVITMFEGQICVNALIDKLSDENIKTYIHRKIEGYPTNIELIVSEEGYGKNPYVETTKKVVVVTAPGANSGKLATCMSQLYHEYKKGVRAGYAKFETFPVWDLPLKHPVNIAYEAATADLNDINMIDSFHLEKYGTTTVNYNRDIATFPILKNILNKITNEDIYYSPTDMGINVISKCITDDDIVREASNAEITRRYFRLLCQQKQGLVESDAVNRVQLLMSELNLELEDRDVVRPAREKSVKENKNVVAIKLPSGEIVTGKETDLLTASSTLIINSVKRLCNIDDDVHLLSPSVLKEITKLKKDILSNNKFLLDIKEVLIALSICSTTNPLIDKALNNLGKLKNCEAHSTCILNLDEMSILKKLKINITCDPKFSIKSSR